MDKEQLKALIEPLYYNKDGIHQFSLKFLSKFLHKDTPDFHVEIYELLKTTLRLAMAAPRSFAKTTVVDVIYPIYLGVLKQDFRDSIAIFSASQSLSVEQLKKIKHEFETNEALIQLYVQIWNELPKSSTWREDEILLSNGVRMQACGAGGQTRGKRPNVIICDDLETTEGVRSPDRRKQLDEWFRKDILGMLEPTGQLIIIGTILHYDSLLKNLIDESSKWGWETKLWQAYKQGKQEEGYELWRDKWSHTDLQLKKAEQGSAFFASEYMNDPVSEETAVFKQSNIRRYDKLPDKYSMVMVYDPAYSDDNKADYKTCVLIAIDDKNNRYLHETIRTHNPTIDYLNESINLFLKYKQYITQVGIPKGREVDFYNKCIEFASSRKVALPHTEIKNVHSNSTVTVRSKKERITMALQGLFQQGKYYIREGLDEAVDELLHHPHGKHDDLIDPMAAAEQIIIPVYFDTVYAGEEIRPVKIEHGESGYGEVY